MIIYTPATPAESIPVVDLASSFSGTAAERREVAWNIHKAGRETGFFYIANHGVPAQMMAAQLALARTFFALPIEEKMKVDAQLSPCMRGYEAICAQTLDDGSPPDLKEGFLAGCDLDEDHPYVRAGVPNCGPNQWPTGRPEFRDQMTAYSQHVVALGRHLMACLALSLDLDEGFFDAGLEAPMYTVRLLHYPPHPDNAAFNQLGAGAHTDWGAITILLQDDVGGLEVQNAAGNWISAPPVAGTFVVNMGEMVRVLTNGLYHANMHRVINNTSGRSRFSVPTFFDPNYFYRVRCVPTLLPENGTPAYPETTVGEHIAHMYRKTYGLTA